MDHLQSGRTLRIRRGTKDLPEERSTLDLPMDLIDQAERRLHEVRLVSTATATELKGLFNEAANGASKYMAWIEYEILKAKKQLDLDRATVILDKLPAEAARLMDTGMKMNKNMRDALISRDEDCQYALDVLNSLQAMKALMDSYYWTFIRAHKSVEEVSNRRNGNPTPNFGGHVGQTFDMPQVNIMGKDERKNNG